MTCVTCGGWGRVLRVKTVPPTSVEARVKHWRHVLKTLVPGQVAEQLCVSCGGYGSRPDPNRGDTVGRR